MNNTIKEQLDKTEKRLDEVLDNTSVRDKK